MIGAMMTGLFFGKLQNIPMNELHFSIIFHHMGYSSFCFHQGDLFNGITTGSMVIITLVGTTPLGGGPGFALSSLTLTSFGVPSQQANSVCVCQK